MATNIRKIFKPDVMFTDFIKTCWCDNVRTIEWTNYDDKKEGKLPIHKELKANGIYALSIEPLQEKDYFVFVLPINKTWDPEDLTKWKEPVLNFDIIGCTKFSINIQIMDDNGVSIQKEELTINESEDWTHISIPINKNSKARILNISGSIAASNFLIKDIVLKEK